MHTHHRMATFYMHFLKRICHIKLISTLHGSFDDKKFLTRMIYKDIDIIACGNIVKQVFVKNYKINENHITVINNAIKKLTSKNEKFDLNKYGIKSNNKIAYIGRLSEEKGVNLLIDAMPAILEKIEDACLIIVGSGHLEEELKNRVKELNIEKSILFLGYQSEIQSIIKEIDLVVLPSYTEGLPLTPIEAFAYGKPVVATAAGGTVEIINNGINGYLVPIGNSEMLSNKIQEVLKDKKLYQEMCVEAVKTYEKKYDFAVFKSNILKYYKKIVEENYEKK